VFSGSSVGALFCALLAEGYSIEEILFLSLNYVKVNLNHVSKHKKELMETFDGIFKNKTFKDYEREGKYLIITAWDSMNSDNIYYNSFDYPDYFVKNAVYESVNIPSIDFTTDENYDGSLCTPIPIKFTKKLMENNNIDIESYLILFVLWNKPYRNGYLLQFLNIIISFLFNKIVLHEIEYTKPTDIVYCLNDKNALVFENEIGAFRAFIDSIINFDDFFILKTPAK